MANTGKKPPIGRDADAMHAKLDLFEATRKLDIAAVKFCVENDPACVHELDQNFNNVMHLCVTGFASLRPRGREIMEFFLYHTGIDVHQKNRDGLDPFELASKISDKKGSELIEPVWYQQLEARFPSEPRTDVYIQSYTPPKGPGFKPN